MINVELHNINKQEEVPCAVLVFNQNLHSNLHMQSITIVYPIPLKHSQQTVVEKSISTPSYCKYELCCDKVRNVQIQMLGTRYTILFKSQVGPERIIIKAPIRLCHWCKIKKVPSDGEVWGSLLVQTLPVDDLGCRHPPWPKVCRLPWSWQSYARR